MRWLLTGGAGYIGGHVLRSMKHDGIPVAVLDDLSTGDKRRVPSDVPLIIGSILDPDILRTTLRRHSITGVIHLAGKKSVSESVADPLKYYRENVSGTLTLLEAMADVGVGRLVLSSSAAVYGSPDSESVSETVEARPESPYGRSKLVAEWMVHDAAVALGLSCVNLRYFNVVGCSEPALADMHGSNLFPLVLGALTAGKRPVVYGDDYPTRDGSCLRDYIHVQDLAEAHVAAAHLVTAGDVDETINIGCGVGHTVFEVLETMARSTGRDTTPQILGRRPGDPAGMVASADRAQSLLGWKARKNLHDMVDSAWRATLSNRRERADVFPQAVKVS